MKKNIFFKLLFLSTFVLSLSIAFVGCKNYDDDIDALEKRVDALEDLIPKGAFVNNVLIENGKLVVKYTVGEDKSYELAGEGKSITIGSDGYWYEGGVKTNFKIAAGSPRVSDDGYLEFPEVGSDGKTVTWKKSDIYASGAYVVDAGSEYELWVAEKGKTELKKIVLSKGSNISKIDILGWIAGKGEADEKIARFQNGENGEDFVSNNITNPFVVNYAWIDHFAIEQTESGYQSGIDGEDRLAEPWKVNNADVTKWSAQVDVEKLNVLNTLVAERKGILINVHPANALVKELTFEIQNSKQDGVLPLKMEAPELVTGLLIQQSRAAESSALWFVPFTFTDEKFADADKGAEPHSTVENDPASHQGYADHYLEDALYTLVVGTGMRSEYSYFTITANPVSSFEAAIGSPVTEQKEGGVVGADGKAAEFGKWNNNTVPTSIDPVSDGAYRVYRGTTYSLDFIETISPAQIDNSTDMVIDYYMEVYDNNEYVDDNFKVQIDKKNGTFTVTRLPDPLTKAYFTLRVYKLGVDGAVYIEHINIFPVQNIQGAIIRTGDYLVVDADTKTNNGLLSDFDTNRSLDPMFAELTEPSGQSMTWAQRWQNKTYGARSWKFASITIDGKAVNGDVNDPNHYRFTAADGTIWDPNIDEFVAAYTTAGGKFAFLEKNEAVADDEANNLTPSTSYNAGDTDIKNDGVFGSIEDADGNGSLYKARYFTFQPPYAITGVSNNPVALFDIGAKYVFEIEFLDDAANYLSTATVELTPTLPALKDFFKKEDDKYWPDADDKNLSAFYRTPLRPNQYEKYFYGTAATTNAPWDTHSTEGMASTYYNVFATGTLHTEHDSITPYDGGYTVFGDASDATGKKWLSVIGDPNVGTNYSKLAYQWASDTKTVTQINGKNAGDYLVLDADKPTIVELVNQTPYETTSAWGYNTPVAMTIDPGFYLGVYDYAAYDATKGQLKDLDFNMTIMSAIERGKVTGAEGDKIIVTSAGGDLVELFEEDFLAKDYNDNKYNLFKGANGYSRNDIYKVEFYMPQGLQGVGSAYTFYNEDGSGIPGPIATEIPAAAGANGKKAHINLKSSNGDQTFTSKIGVRVIDRFGKVKETVIDFEVKRNTTN